MSRPRISRICSSSRSSSERPSNVIRPFGIFPVRRGSSRMIESAVTDLPDPDSPTMATTSPRSTVKLTPSTARTMPRAVANWVCRSSTSSSGAAVSGRASRSARKSSVVSATLNPGPPRKLTAGDASDNHELSSPARRGIGAESVSFRRCRCPGTLQRLEPAAVLFDYAAGRTSILLTTMGQGKIFTAVRMRFGGTVRVSSI